MPIFIGEPTWLRYTGKTRAQHIGFLENKYSDGYTEYYPPPYKKTAILSMIEMSLEGD